MAESIFNSAQLPDKNDPDFNGFGNKEIKLLANFYGKEVEVDFRGSKFKSSPILEADQLISEWPVFHRALQKEKEALVSSKSLKKAPSFQEVWYYQMPIVKFSDFIIFIWLNDLSTVAVPTGSASKILARLQHAWSEISRDTHHSHTHTHSY